ncbi:MAG: pyridoxamine 5'-phosphate oxidase family protein [Ginsengibacter sp.]|jgi:general stress protein 26
MGQIKNLRDEEAIKKIKELVDDITTCMFCTQVQNLPFKTRPMATLDVDDEGNMWFMSSRESNKNDEIKSDDQVQLIYAKGGDSHFLSINGKAYIEKDQAKIDELWNVYIKAWFQGGKKDPDITVIKVVPDTAYYWDTVHGKMVSLLKIAASVVSGKTMDDGIEGKISV